MDNEHESGESLSCERIIRDIETRFFDLSEKSLSKAAYLPEDSLAVKADQFFEQLLKNDFNYSAISTCSTPQEPLTLERMMRTFQALRDEWSEPAVKIMSPTEYLRRTGFRLPLSEETLAELEPPSLSLTQLKQELIYGASFMHGKDFYQLSLTPEGTPNISLTAVGSQHMIEELKALSSAPSWTISPKTRHQLERLAARKRRQYRAWLRAKRQRRARQRRHNQGLR